MNESFSMASSGQPRLGTLLAQVLWAQERDEQATSFPLISDFAQRIIAVAHNYKLSILWPVGNAAERLVGAATVLGGGSVRARGWSTSLPNQSVLLVGTHATAPHELLVAAAHARAMGATAVHACAIDIDGIEAVSEGQLDSYRPLADDFPAPRSRSSHREAAAA